jgi:hypothetical protein
MVKVSREMRMYAWECEADLHKYVMAYIYGSL